MPEDWMIAAGIAAGVVAGLALSLGTRRREEAVAFANEREERLTRKLAERVLGGWFGK